MFQIKIIVIFYKMMKTIVIIVRYQFHKKKKDKQEDVAPQEDVDVDVNMGNEPPRFDLLVAGSPDSWFLDQERRQREFPCGA